jgi:hypothetical protein
MRSGSNPQALLRESTLIRAISAQKPRNSTYLWSVSKDVNNIYNHKFVSLCQLTIRLKPDIDLRRAVHKKRMPGRKMIDQEGEWDNQVRHSGMLAKGIAPY